MLKPEKCSLSLNFFFIKPTAVLVCIYFIIVISAVNVKNGACVIPEASQEGPLRSFKSYEDLVIFHYSVPKQVLRATWQFAAFVSDSKCPQREVNIFLKWGSYPVIGVNDETFPSHVVKTDGNDTIRAAITTFEPKSMITVPAYSPEPGDWFVAAYLADGDEQIHQKGLGVDCRYSLGSVAVWSTTNGIENIPLGYQKVIKTSEAISYYKIYIPTDTWNFQVDIWGCNFTVKQAPNFHGPCIKDLALKGRSLPFYNHSVKFIKKSLTPMDTYTFLESSPYQDEWYYLMVVSSSAIRFSVKVTVTYCPIKTVEEVFISHYIDVPKDSGEPDQLYLKNLKQESFKWYSPNNAINQSKTKNYALGADRQSYDMNDRASSCITRYQLVRIKHAQVFTGDYLLRGREWLTSWLTLSDTYPVITQFDILPLVDIGGTLDINVYLEMNETRSRQQVNVDICVSRWQRPKFENGHFICNGKNVAMTISSNKRNSSKFLIPYPQAGTWYIAFKATCYVNGMPVHCKMEEILVSLNVKLRACALEGSKSCGQYGTCEEIHKGQLHFSACKCFGGRQGWDCTDATNAEYSFLLTNLALILSNLLFIPAIYLALTRTLYTEGLVYVSTMFFSSLYHACDSSFYCIAKFEVLQFCDFFFGILAFWVTLISMANVPVQYTSLCHMLGTIIITFGVQNDKTGLNSILVPLIVGCFIPLASYGLECRKIKKIVWPKNALNLIVGLTFATLGILLYSLVETENNYRYVHSAWHAIIAISLIFLLPIKGNQIIKTSDKWERCEESPSNYVFVINGRRQNNHLIQDIG